jgi:hypothetical protein
MARTDRIEADAEVVARLGNSALAVPEAYEDAWTGIRWRIRARAFAHVMVAPAGFESSFRDVTGVADPTACSPSASPAMSCSPWFTAAGRSISRHGHRRSSGWRPPTTPTGRMSPIWSSSGARSAQPNPAAPLSRSLATTHYAATATATQRGVPGNYRAPTLTLSGTRKIVLQIRHLLVDVESRHIVQLVAKQLYCLG